MFPVSNHSLLLIKTVIKLSFDNTSVNCLYGSSEKREENISPRKVNV